jgi:hypothetical protein
MVMPRLVLRGEGPGDLARLVLLLMVGVMAVGCCSVAPVSQQASQGPVLHIVVCWLHEPGDVEARRRLIETSRQLESIPGVVSVAAGEAAPSEREIVDDSFDVAVVMSFRDEQALASYLTHPRHRDAVREVLRPLVERMVVYDLDARP